MGCGFVGTLTADLHLPQSGSLKDKRKELQRLKAALSKRTNCAIAEVDHHDLHRRTRVTLAVVTRDAGACEQLLGDARRLLYDDPAFVVLGDAYEVGTVDDTPMFVRGEA